MDKNDILTGTIEDLTVSGEGVARVDGFPFFIKDTVIGDEVRFVVTRLKKNYAYGRALEILKPSADRVEPVCPVYKRCGGCTLQAMSYKAQLAFKDKLVYNDLLRIGEVPQDILDAAREPVIGSDKQFHYRNKAQFPFGTGKDKKPVCGFYAARTHEIVPYTDCALGLPVNKTILEAVLSFMEEYNVPAYDEEKAEGVVRHVLIRSSKDGCRNMVCIVINSDTLPKADKLIDMLRKIEGVASVSVNINKKRTNVILGDRTKTLWGTDTILDTIESDASLIGDGSGPGRISLDFEISPQSFFQVNPSQTGRLYSVALDYAALTGGETVWDLYCGIGTISLFMANRAGLVIGVESVAQAIEDAGRNAERNGIKNVGFICGRAEEVTSNLLHRRDLSSPDVIVVDPPRKGCDEACLNAILTASPARIVYVSCDPATLARDIKFLRAGGYELMRYRPVDQFCQGVHVETVCLLSNTHKKKEFYITLDVEMADYYRIKNEGKTT